MNEPVQNEPVQNAPNSRRHRSTIALSVVVALLVIAAGFGGYQLHRQSGQLSDIRTALADLRSSQADSAKATTDVLTATQAQVASLQAALTKTQNDLKRDEQLLKLTTAQLPPDVTKLASKVSASVVMLACGNALGTGFVLNVPPASGYVAVVVTAAHVVADCAPKAEPEPQLLTVLHGNDTIDGHVRAADTDEDVALVDIAVRLPALKPAGPPTTGEFAMAVGNPLGLSNNVTQGNVSKVDDDVLFHTAPISSGNSGGPLVDREGRVLGIVDAALTAPDSGTVVENLNIAVRLSALCSTLLKGSACSTLH